MDEAGVRASATAFADAVVAGDMGTAIGYLSDELRRNVGEVIALLPLPATEATITSVEHASSAHVVILHIVGETSLVELQTRWKERDGGPRIVEVSHLRRTEREVAAPVAEGEESAESSG